jgi:two-component system cell cycle sensor histidine kinase/response regulator CckA
MNQDSDRPDRVIMPESTEEERLREAQKMESLRKLAGGIAHDFNNILNVILGTLALLRSKTQGDPAIDSYLSMGENAVRRGVDVAKRLGMFAQVDNPQHVPISASDLLAEVGGSLRNSIQKTIRVETLTGPNLPLLRASRPQLYQSLLTLGLNARDAITAANTAEGAITFRAETVDGGSVQKLFREATSRHYVCVTVSDNGPGIAGEKRRRIFEPLIRSEQPDGIRGLGLATVYNVVRAHHGFVNVFSEIGRGTVFSLYFPAIHVDTAIEGEPGTEPVPGGTETILVVEDEEAILLLLDEVLRDRGYTVLTAADGIEGFEVYMRHAGALAAVIADVGLPRQSGLEMFLKIREHNPRARVILVSGYLSPELKSSLFVAGAKEFIPKPFQPAEVLRKLRQVLDLPD